MTDVGLDRTQRNAVRGQPVLGKGTAHALGLDHVSDLGRGAVAFDVGGAVVADLAFEVPGQVARVEVDLGEAVEDGDVLFVDEIHRLSPVVEEVLYPAMEDYQLDIMIGEGPAARSIKLDLPPFTLVGATTRAGLLTSPLRDRFGIVQRLEFYEVADLAHIVERSARILEIGIDQAGAAEIGEQDRAVGRQRRQQPALDRGLHQAEPADGLTLAGQNQAGIGPLARRGPGRQVVAAEAAHAEGAAAEPRKGALEGRRPTRDVVGIGGPGDDVGPGGYRLGQIPGKLDAPIGDQRDAILFQFLGHIGHGRDLRHADAGDDAGGADGTRADTDLDRIGARLSQRFGGCGGGGGGFLWDSPARVNKDRWAQLRNETGKSKVVTACTLRSNMQQALSSRR